jgi:hypothetical protein
VDNLITPTYKECHKPATAQSVKYNHHTAIFNKECLRNYTQNKIWAPASDRSVSEFHMKNVHGTGKPTGELD